MKLTTGKMKITENKAKNKFFKDVRIGDVLEVELNLNKYITYGSASTMIEVKNITQGTSRTGAPIHLNSGFEKMKWVEPKKTGEDRIKELESALEACRGYAKSIKDQGHREVHEAAYIIDEVNKVIGVK